MKDIGQTYRDILKKLNWRKIEGFGCDYYVNNNGDICSVTPNGKLRPLKPWYVNGYGYVKLRCKDGVYRDRRINRLICLTYHDNPDNLPVAHHKNHERGDNRHVNLKWATYKENALNRRGKADKGGK